MSEKLKLLGERAKAAIERIVQARKLPNAIESIAREANEEIDKIMQEEGISEENKASGVENPEHKDKDKDKDKDKTPASPAPAHAPKEDHDDKKEKDHHKKEAPKGRAAYR